MGDSTDALSAGHSEASIATTGDVVEQGVAERSKRRSKAEKGSKPYFNASHCSYDVIISAAESRGWKVTKNEDKISTCNVHWIDDGGVSQWCRNVEPWMRINHFPGLFDAIVRKTRLARTMQKMQRIFPAEYRFVPDGWVLPEDTAELAKRFEKTAGQGHSYIVKPDDGTQGRGIFLATHFESIRNRCDQRDGPIVVQEYIARPMLIDGLKFDLRLYFLMTAVLQGSSLVPRYFLMNDGLVRLCTTPYEAPSLDNIDQKCMHLTNYAINKHSSDFVRSEDANDNSEGSKRSLRWFLNHLAEQHGEVERDKLWKKLCGLCVKTVLPAHPIIEAAYYQMFPRDLSNGQMGCRCFAIIGADVMIDTKLKPYLIELNHLPSFKTCDSPLDRDVKQRVIEQALEITCGTVTGNDRQKYEAAVAEAGSVFTSPDGVAEALDPVSAVPDSLQVRDFQRIYPDSCTKVTALYDAILAKARESFRSPQLRSAKISSKSAIVHQRGSPTPGVATRRRQSSSARAQAPPLARKRSPTTSSLRLLRMPCIEAPGSRMLHSASMPELRQSSRAVLRRPVRHQHR